MTSDLNKGITSITYNHLNLPVEVVYGGDNAMRYSYDASGRRLSAEYGIISWVIDGGGTVEPVNPGIGGGDVPGLLSTAGAGNGASTGARAPSRVKRVKTFLVRSRRDYCDSFLYADGELERILTESGWYSPGGSYTATVNDHQGNLRSTLTKSYATPSASTDLVGGSGTAGSGDLVGDLGGAGGTIGSGGVIGIGGGTIGGGIVEPQKPRLRYANLTAYSPYGLPLTDWQGEERYLYSRKELDRTGGLMLYDFHARQYDPQLGRFTSPDPLQGQSPGNSPYLYCSANPISRIDPSGLMDFYDTSGKHVGHDENGPDAPYMVVGKKENKSYDAAIGRGEYLPIVEGLIEKMTEIEGLTSDDNLERAFIVDEEDQISEIITGDKDHVDLGNDDGQFQRAKLDVHTHPKKDTDGKPGAPAASPGDLDSERERAKISNNVRVNIVIGYEAKEVISRGSGFDAPGSKVFGGEKEIRYTPMVGFYSTYNINKPVRLDKLQKTIPRILNDFNGRKK